MAGAAESPGVLGSPRQWQGACLVGIVAASLYSATLWQPFDFEDDGALVYTHAVEPGLGPRWQTIRERTWTDLNTRGPCRPVLWAYFELNELAWGQNALGWHATRLAWLAVAAALFFELMRELGIPRWPAAVAVLFSLAAPMRSSIWYRLGLVEAIAMPMVMLALLAACRASSSRRPWLWDSLGLASVVAAILTKNVFVAVVPCQMLLRLWPAHTNLAAALRRHWRAGLVLSLSAVIPLLHLLYFKTAVEVRSEYQVVVPGIREGWRMLRAILLAGGVDFLAVGVLLALAGVLVSPAARAAWMAYGFRRLAVVASALCVSGWAVYLPALGTNAPAGRYTIPAVWGVDLLLAGLVTLLPSLENRRRSWLAGGALAVGALAVGAVNLYQQNEFGQRCRVLWQTMAYVRDHAEPNAHVAAVAPVMSRAEFFHFEAHLRGQGRADLRCRYHDANEPLVPGNRTLVLYRRGGQAAQAAAAANAEASFEPARGLLTRLVDPRQSRRRNGGIAVARSPALR